MEILDLNLPNKVMGKKSILPVLKGKKMEDRPLFWHFPIYLGASNESIDDGRGPLFRTRPGSVILYRNWKLHHYFEDDGLELYNLEKVLGKRKNLATSHSKKVQELYNLLDSW